jgi:glycosyltransferase involved in cell wall biosynthesis
MSAPLVSVIIPAYNAARYLPATLQSCFDQTYPHLEIIVVDDGSSDETAQLMAGYPSVQYIRQANQGPAIARNTGMEQARGDYLQFLDADDLLLPPKIERCLAGFEAHPQAGVVYCDYEYRTPDLQALSPVPKPHHTQPQGKIAATLIHSTATYWCVPCPLVKSDLARQVGGFTPGFNGVEDWHFWIKLAAQGAEFWPLPEVLVWYRHSPTSLSRNPVLMAQSRLAAMQALRGLPLPPEVDLEEKIAGRHHALAMRLWYEGQPVQARQHFQQAKSLHPKGRRLRQFLAYSSYLLPARLVDGLVSRISARRAIITSKNVGEDDHREHD